MISNALVRRSFIVTIQESIYAPKKNLDLYL